MNKNFMLLNKQSSFKFSRHKKIVISDKFKHNDDGFKYFIGCLHDDDVIRPLCIILPQMRGYIKNFDNAGKNMSFKIEDEGVHLKYIEISNKIKKSLIIKFHCMFYSISLYVVCSILCSLAKWLSVRL